MKLFVIVGLFCSQSPSINLKIPFPKVHDFPWVTSSNAKVPAFTPFTGGRWSLPVSP